jgi:Zn-dependent protease
MTLLLMLATVPQDFWLTAIGSLLIAVTIGMTVHEFAHNYAAHLMGDPYPQRWGKLTLNPLAHIYWPGWIMWMVIGFGALGSAPVSPDRLPRENRRYRWLAVIAAGPISNLLVAVAAALIFQLLRLNFLNNVTFFYAMYVIIQMNVLLFLFNLLPFFPIDGWSIVYCLLPPSLAYEWERYREMSQYVLYGLILISFALPSVNILGMIITGPMLQIVRFLMQF